MTATKHSDCYGKLFPDFGHLNYNRLTEGKAFNVFVENIGCGRQRRELIVKPEAWDECLTCPDFDFCYDLSMAKLALHEALQNC